MKPIEWLILGVLGIGGYFFWTSRTQQTTSPACPAQTQLDGWLSDIASGKIDHGQRQRPRAKLRQRDAAVH